MQSLLTFNANVNVTAGGLTHYNAGGVHDNSVLAALIYRACKADVLGNSKFLDLIKHIIMMIMHFNTRFCLSYIPKEKMEDKNSIASWIYNCKDAFRKKDLYCNIFNPKQVLMRR